ncbi:MAG: GntR family transcriptional regulator [Oscillospiraceae bacterium]|nr:GntR family transcriptional regulator [Oscillospiraceae bacterium]
MSVVPLLLQNDQLLYDALIHLGAFSGGRFPTQEELHWQTGLSAAAVSQALDRLCQSRILKKGPDGAYSVLPRPLYLHYREFRSFGQMLESAAGSLRVDLLFAGPAEADAYTAETLSIPPAETVIHILRLYSKDDIPFAYEEYDVLYPLLKNVPKAEFQKSSVLGILQNNLPPDSRELVQSQYFSMLPSREPDQRYLQLPPGESILRITGRIYWENQPICSFTIRADADQCALKSRRKFP